MQGVVPFLGEFGPRLRFENEPSKNEFGVAAFVEVSTVVYASLRGHEQAPFLHAVKSNVTEWYKGVKTMQKWAIVAIRNGLPDAVWLLKGTKTTP
jgi:hypothetical protein